MAYKRLGDVVNFKRGYDLPSYEREDGKYPIISSSGISGYHNRYKLDGEGVVIGRYGTLGTPYYVTGKYWPHNTALYVTDFNGNSPKYIYYLLSCLGNLQTAAKSTVPGINRNDLHEVLIPILNKDDQHNIASVLSSLDSKIELNNRINQELEAIAKLIYDYWFVQFDFPMSKEQAEALDKPELIGKPYKASGGPMVWNAKLKREIPEGWKTFGLSELLKCNYSSISKTSPPSVINYLDTSNLTDNRIENLVRIDTANEKTPSRAQRLLRKNDILYSTVRPNQRHFGIVVEPEENMVASTGFAQLSSKVPWLDNELIFIFLTSTTIIERLQQIAELSVSAYPSVSPWDILSLQIALPTDLRLISSFTSISKPIYRSIWKNMRESQQLSSLRDWLLPMLMNGQVKVQVPTAYKFEEEEVRMVAEPEVRYESNRVERKSALTTTDMHAAVLSKIIHLHEKNPEHLDNLSHIKCEKIAHLVEYHLGIDLGRNPVKDAAGPDDYPHLKKVESRAMKAGFFTKVKKDVGYAYQSGRQAPSIVSKAENVLGNKKVAQLNEFLDLILPFSLQQAEVLATTYAGWNNLLLDGLNPTNEEIVTESRENWSKRKLGIDRSEFFKAIEWMRKNGMVPSGRGKRVNTSKKRA